MKKKFVDAKLNSYSLGGAIEDVVSLLQETKKKYESQGFESLSLYPVNGHNSCVDLFGLMEDDVYEKWKKEKEIKRVQVEIERLQSDLMELKDSQKSR